MDHNIDSNCNSFENKYKNKNKNVDENKSKYENKNKYEDEFIDLSYLDGDPDVVSMILDEKEIIDKTKGFEVCNPDYDIKKRKLDIRDED